MASSSKNKQQDNKILCRRCNMKFSPQGFGLHRKACRRKIKGKERDVVGSIPATLLVILCKAAGRT